MKLFLLNLAVSLVGGSGGSTINNIPSRSADQVLHDGLNLAYFLAAIIAVIVIIVGGIIYATSAGNSGNVTKAKNLIMYAIIGLVLVMAAFAVTSFVVGRF